MTGNSFTWHVVVSAIAVLVLWTAATTNTFETWDLVGSPPWWEVFGILEGIWLGAWIVVYGWGR